MKALKGIGLGLLVMIVLLYMGSFFLPSTIHVESSMTINASQEQVFQQVNNVTNWKAWSPWAQQYQDMKTTYGNVTVGKGANYRWESETAGNGSLRITTSESPQYIQTKLDFGDQGTVIGEWKFEQNDDSTTVVWSMSRDMGNNPIGKYMGLMMKGMIKSDFEQGLKNMKELVEKG